MGISLPFLHSLWLPVQGFLFFLFLRGAGGRGMKSFDLPASSSRYFINTYEEVYYHLLLLY